MKCIAEENAIGDVEAANQDAGLLGATPISSPDESADENHGENGHGGEAHGEEGHGEEGHEGDGEHHEDHNYLSQEHLLGHVQDGSHFEYSGMLLGGSGTKHVDIPQYFQLDKPIFGRDGEAVEGFDFRVTKFMVIEVAVAIVLVAIFVPLAQRIKSGAAPRGRFWNFFESILLFVRDEVARPSIGKHDADRFLPFLWSVFFFVLFCNLFGLIPFLGSPTGSMSVTAVLALSTLVVVLATGIKKMGFVGFWKAQVPHMDLPPLLAVVIIPMIFVIEVLGLFMKHFVLALRLFANMFAGHIVLAALMGMIGMVWGGLMMWLVAPASVGASVGVNLLELFVAFLQAYVFTFLSALFIGAAAHPH